MKVDWVVHGRAWVFGDNVDTDHMAPWGHMGDAFEARRPHLFPTRPGFAAEVGPGDIVVAGRNWGCGSSREQAPENLKRLGVAAVVAESFGRIYFRNSVAISLPAIQCAGIGHVVAEGEDIEVDVETATVTNLTRATTRQGRPYTDDMLAIMRAGGLLAVLQERISSGHLDPHRG